MGLVNPPGVCYNGCEVLYRKTRGGTAAGPAVWDQA